MTQAQGDSLIALVTQGNGTLASLHDNNTVLAILLALVCLLLLVNVFFLAVRPSWKV